MVLNSRLVYEKLAQANGYPIIPEGALSGIEGHSKLKGDGGGAGFNLGALYNITEDIKAGVSYRSPVRIRYFGDTEFRRVNSKGKHPLVAFINAALIDTSAKTKITMTPQFLAGISYNAFKDLTLEFDLDWM